MQTEMSPWRACLVWDSLLLAGVCCGDMLSTLYWVHAHLATEANPWMAFLLQHGPLAFCGVKLLSFLPMLAFAAYHRARRPRLIAFSLRATLALYTAIYIGSLVVQALNR